MASKKTAAGKATATKAAAKSAKKGGAASGAPKPAEDGALSAKRIDELRAAAAAFKGKVLPFPGHARQRMKHLQAMARAASEDAPTLVQTPFHGESALTTDEIARFTEQVAFLQWAESNRRATVGDRAEAAVTFEQMAPVARGHVTRLLRALDLRYRNDPAGRKRVSAIRAGEGDADTVQDVSDVIAECAAHEAFLASCPQGEAESLAWLKSNLPALTKVLAAKAPSSTPVEARRLRDIAFTLATLTERRLRAASDYWFDGNQRASLYAAFVPSTKAGEGEEEGDTRPTG